MCGKTRINEDVIMWKDPIVQDIRKAYEILAKQANYDLHTYFQNLRINEKKRKPKIVSRLNVDLSIWITSVEELPKHKQIIDETLKSHTRRQ